MDAIQSVCFNKQTAADGVNKYCKQPISRLCIPPAWAPQRTRDSCWQ